MAMIYFIKIKCSNGTIRPGGMGLKCRGRDSRNTRNNVSGLHVVAIHGRYNAWQQEGEKERYIRTLTFKHLSISSANHIEFRPVEKNQNPFYAPDPFRIRIKLVGMNIWLIG